MKIWSMVLAIAVAIALLPSCREKTETSSRVVVTAIGIDQGEQEDCRLSIQAIELLKTAGSLTEQAENATNVYTIEDETVAGALKSFVTQTGRSAYVLHNRAIVIGLEQAKRRPLSSLLDYFIRNHAGRSTVDMVICRGDAAELLEVPSAGYTIPAEHLSLLIQEANQYGFAVSSELLDVEKSTSGMYDAAIPIVRVDKTGEELSMSVDGTAVFRQGQYVGELDAAATRGLLFGRGDLQQCLYVLDKPDGGGKLTVEVESARTAVSVDKAGLNASFRLQVSCRATVLEEYSPAALTSAQLSRVQEALEQAIRADTQAAIHHTVDLWACDVYGFSRMVRKKQPDLVRGHEDEWPARLHDCAFSIKVTAQVAKAGGEAGGGIMQK